LPKFLEEKLKKEYPNNDAAVYGTMNAIGAMKGNKETEKGRRMQEKHEKKSSPRITPAAADRIIAKTDRITKRR
jgi:hypothetical protein